MSNGSVVERIGAVVAWIFAFPSLLLGTVGVNIITLVALIVIWLLWPLVGAIAFTIGWANLVGYRLIFGEQMRRAFPATVNHQNGSSACMIAVGVIGALRSWFASDIVGLVLGLLGATILLLSQSTLFRPSTLP